MQSIEFTTEEAKELYICYIGRCRGNSAREINPTLDKKMRELALVVLP